MTELGYLKRQLRNTEVRIVQLQKRQEEIKSFLEIAISNEKSNAKYIRSQNNKITLKSLLSLLNNNKKKQYSKIHKISKRGTFK